MENAKNSEKYSHKNTPLQKVLTIIGLLLCVIFAFLLTCNLTIIIKGFFFPEKPPSVLGITPMAVLSGSMSGTAEDHIEIGDLIFIDKIEPEELKVGDVIAFMEGKIVVTHRIVEIQTDDGLQFITKGDANNANDRKPVTEDNLVGIYSRRIPKLGDAALFMQTPLGMFLFVGVPVMGFIIYDMIRRQRYATKEQARQEELQAEIARLQALVDGKVEEPARKDP